MQPVPWNDLQDFFAVARAGRLARAAATMGVDATTIARRLRRLEQRLGQTLFEQTREGQVLTELGERLLGLVETMGRAAERVNEQPSQSEGLSGLLRVSVSEGFCIWFVSRHLHEFIDRHPGLTIDLVARSHCSSRRIRRSRNPMAALQQAALNQKLIPMRTSRVHTA